MHIRTDDEVYRVDAVWLGPPRATFPWRARYSAYGVGLLVMIVVMFLQRRLGIDLGFFSLAWALLITVLITRFVSRRINDERPLLEWLTLFVHELKGPRARTRGVGGALATAHVTVRRDRPRALGPATAVALPRGSSARAREVRAIAPRVGATDDADAVWGPPPEDARRTRRRPAAADTPTTEASARRPTHLTPGPDDAGPAHAPRTPRARRRGEVRGARRVPTTRGPADADFGPPSAADVGPARTSRADPAGVDPHARRPHELPSVARPSAAQEVAAWTGRREPQPVRVRPVDPAEQGPFGPGSRSPRGGA